MTRSTLARTIALVLIVALGALAWSAGIRHRFFDYDEIYHAHATWLIASGDTPFHDFQASHLPFLWYPFAAVWWLFPNSPSALFPLRVAAAAGTLLTLIFMMASAAAVRRDLPKAWLVTGMALVAFNRDVLDFGIEFRPESWSTALLFLGFYLLLTERPAAIRARCALFGLLAGLSVIASPKFFLLPVLFAVLDVLDRVRRRDQPRRAVLGYTAGVLTAGVLALVLMRAIGVSPQLAFGMGVEYQLAFVQRAGVHQGLLDSVLQHPQLTALVALSLAAWGVHAFSIGRTLPVYDLAVVLFLLMQLAIVDRPYKQYYGPWFLLAATFIPCIGTLLHRWSARAASWGLAVAMVASAWSASSALRSFRQQDQAHQLLAFYNRMIDISSADARIVAYPPLHPIVRRDVFYGWSRTIDPEGYGTEAIMRDLAIPGYSVRFDRAYYRGELDARPPALVVAALDGEWAYEPAQWAELRDYLAAHRAEYDLVEEGLLRPLWVRRDRRPQ